MSNKSRQRIQFKVPLDNAEPRFNVQLFGVLFKEVLVQTPAADLQRLMDGCRKRTDRQALAG